LYGANLDGSGISAATGTFSSTTAGQAMTFINDQSGPFIHYNSNDGVLLNYVSSASGNFAGTFLFSDLVSTNNGGYGFNWTMNGHTPGSITLQWGTGGTSAACLINNTSGPVGSLPSGAAAPTSTSTCP
jgi:hypothetical protein